MARQGHLIHISKPVPIGRRRRPARRNPDRIGRKLRQAHGVEHARAFDLARGTGRPRRNLNAFKVERHDLAHRIKVEIGERGHIGEPLALLPHRLYTQLGQARLDRVAICGLPGEGLKARKTGRRRRAKSGYARAVFRAAAQGKLLAAAAPQGLGLETWRIDKRADALRTAQLVRRKRKGVGAEPLDIYRDLARRLNRIDMDQAAEESGGVINAVLLGALAGSGKLPIPDEAFEAAIRAAMILVAIPPVPTPTSALAPPAMASISPFSSVTRGTCRALGLMRGSAV